MNLNRLFTKSALIALFLTLFSVMNAFSQTLTITTSVCTSANEVRMTGPFWQWNPTGGPVAVSNGDGTWTFTFNPAPAADMEYILIVDGVQEDLISDMQNGGTCAPLTDYFSYANRKWVVGSGDVNISYDRCVPCSYPDIVITTEVCSAVTSVRLTGPIWQWNPNYGPAAVSNGDGTYTFTISPAPNDTLEYLLVKDGVVENLIQEMVNGGGCAPITDNSTYANRRWLLGEGAVSNTYGQCGACGGTSLTQMDLPVTFEGTTVEYGVIGFEGAQASTIEVDPTNAANTVVKVVKSATAQPWAGTTITAAAALGLATPIPFTSTNKSMKLRVWSPDAGITVRLKVEEHGDPTHKVETDAVTTESGQWETLTFDFANQVTGTDVINLAYTYDKPSVFFNYGVNGATAGEKTYYFDDLKMFTQAASGLQITVDVCSIAANEVRMTGPFWSWDPTAGPFAVNNNDGTWTFTLDPVPTADMEYLIIVNGVQESLISDMQNGGNCAPVTDFFGYANRKWVVGSGNVFISYDRCVPCSYPNIVITTEVCTPATTVKLTGPNWQWNPNFGPTAVSNGDGTYTFTISPAPNDTLEYLLVKDGVVENLVQEMVNGAGCAPITDYSTYANRRWLLGQGAVANTYGRCSPCSVGIGELTDNDLVVFPNPTNTSVNVISEFTIEKIEVYSMLGELISTKNTTSNEVNVELQNLASGVYTFNVFANGGMKTVRVIKN